MSCTQEYCTCDECVTRWREDRARRVSVAAETPRRKVLYMAHPVRPTPEQLAAWQLSPEPMASAINANINSALRRLAWLRKTLPTVTVIAPWIAGIMSGEDDSDETQRERGLVDCCTVVAMCDAMVCVGGRVSSGMQREMGSARRVFDLTALSPVPPLVNEHPAIREMISWATVLDAAAP